MKTSALAVATCLLLATHAVAQDPTQEPGDSAAAPATAPSPAVPNPFELNFQPDRGMSGMMSMGMDSGISMNPGMDMSMGMGMDMGMDSPPAVSDEKLFRYRLRTAISKLSEAEDAGEKAALLKYTQTALQEQYDAMIARRTADLDRLKQRLATLEADLQNRAAAKDRVVQLQMQSVVLAAEGLLDLNSLQSTSGGGGEGGRSEMSSGN